MSKVKENCTKTKIKIHVAFDIFQEFEEALKSWTEKQKLEKPVHHRPNQLSDKETEILQTFVDATQLMIKKYVNGFNYNKTF